MTKNTIRFDCGYIHKRKKYQREKKFHKEANEEAHNFIISIMDKKAICKKYPKYNFFIVRLPLRLNGVNVLTYFYKKDQMMLKSKYITLKLKYEVE